MTIGILGGGVWGSALAKLFSNNEVLIYTRDKKTMNSINDYHFNPKLKYAIFNDNVKATDDLEQIAKKNIIFIALPTQNIREVLSKSYFAPDFPTLSMLKKDMSSSIENNSCSVPGFQPNNDNIFTKA